MQFFGKKVRCDAISITMRCDCHPCCKYSMYYNRFSFCVREPETIIHLFCMCTKVAFLEENVSSWIKSRLKMRINLQPVHMLFGVKIENKFSSVLNCLFCMLFSLIFQCISSQTNAKHAHVGLLWIKNIKLVEKKIAQKHGKLKDFYKKWNRII